MEVDDRLDRVRTPGAMVRFALPMIVAMVCISTYSVVDGMLISNMIGTDALAGLNIVMPVASLLSALGFMFGSGGSAYIAKKLGEGDVLEARRSFSGLTVVAVVLSTIFAALMLMASTDIVTLLGADDRLFGYAETYLVACLPFAPAFILQYMSVQFLITAGRPDLSLGASLAGGLTNIGLDILFMGPLDMGIGGAAIASGIGSIMAFLVGAVYFVVRKDCPLRFVRPSFEPRMVGKVCSNGASEMVSELSGGITTLLFNLAMMRYIGPDGVAAMTMILYVQFLAIAAVIGYSMGVGPIMSYNYGAKRRDVMRTQFMTSMKVVLLVSIVLFLVMELFGGAVVSVFSGDSETVAGIASHGCVIFSVAFLFLGFNVYVSSMFTSLSNGLLSAAISFLRGLCLLAPMILILPTILGADGIWMAVPITEVVTFALSVLLVLRMGPRYGYLEKGAERSTG